MPQKFVFADEAGCFTFERRANVSKHFILCTVTMDNCEVGDALVALRRELCFRGGYDLLDCFHACEDKQNTRDAVFNTINQHRFTIQATIMEKAKAQAHIRADKPTFYKYGLFFHFKFGVKPHLNQAHDTLVSAAALGQRKERAAFKAAVSDVARQILPADKWRADFPPAATEPCVQVADYCAWALQRKHERGDERSYRLIADKVTYEYDLWSKGTVLHY